MQKLPDNTGQKQDGKFKVGHSGNPAGRPIGSRNKATIAAQALLDGEAEALTKKAVQMALKGDSGAMRLCLERLLPVRKDRCVQFALPEVQSAADAAALMGAVIHAVAKGDVSPTEAIGLASLMETYVKTLEAAEFEERLHDVEAWQKAREFR